MKKIQRHLIVSRNTTKNFFYVSIISATFIFFLLVILSRLNIDYLFPSQSLKEKVIHGQCPFEKCVCLYRLLVNRYNVIDYSKMIFLLYGKAGTYIHGYITSNLFPKHYLSLDTYSIFLAKWLKSRSQVCIYLLTILWISVFDIIVQTAV